MLKPADRIAELQISLLSIRVTLNELNRTVARIESERGSEKIRVAKIDRELSNIASEIKEKIRLEVVELAKRIKEQGPYILASDRKSDRSIEPGSGALASPLGRVEEIRVNKALFHGSYDSNSE